MVGDKEAQAVSVCALAPGLLLLHPEVALGRTEVGLGQALPQLLTGCGGGGGHVDGNYCLCLGMDRPRLGCREGDSRAGT